MKSATVIIITLLLMLTISIHALMKSATKLQEGYKPNFEDFNPRTHEECDTVIDTPRPITTNFNPRTHEECDIAKELNNITIRHFNPRTHEECDDLTKKDKPRL